MIEWESEEERKMRVYLCCIWCATWSIPAAIPVLWCLVACLTLLSSCGSDSLVVLPISVSLKRPVAPMKQKRWHRASRRLRSIYSNLLPCISALFIAVWCHIRFGQTSKQWWTNPQPHYRLCRWVCPLFLCKKDTGSGGRAWYAAGTIS